MQLRPSGPGSQCPSLHQQERCPKWIQLYPMSFSSENDRAAAERELWVKIKPVAGALHQTTLLVTHRLIIALLALSPADKTHL